MNINTRFDIGDSVYIAAQNGRPVLTSIVGIATVIGDVPIANYQISAPELAVEYAVDKLPDLISEKDVYKTIEEFEEKRSPRQSILHS